MIEDVYGVRRAAEVMEDTWGHLRPDVGRHCGYLVAALAGYGGQRVLIDAEFEDVPDSPWLYEAMLDLIDDADMPASGVYRFDGACVVDEVIGGKRLFFEGEWKRVPVVPPDLSTDDRAGRERGGAA